MMKRTRQGDYWFEYQEEPKQEFIDILFEGISEDAVQKKKMDRTKTFGIFIKNNRGVCLGGVNGFSLFGCLYIDMLWVKENLRYQGLGTKLMMEAEKMGREYRCTFSTVNTMDWEALPFYQKLGYEIEFIREGFEKDSKMYMLRKPL
jgi:ribosomal protein S18 acetylase RimI-like enzyme